MAPLHTALGEWIRWSSLFYAGLMFDSASPQEKRMVASYIIKAVTLTRKYGIQVEFNISEAQYLGGMEMK